MKKILSVIIAFTTAFSLWSCDDDPEVNTILDSDPKIFSISPIAITPSADGGTYDLKITGQGEWSIATSNFNTIKQDWISFNKLSGSGPETIQITITPSISFTKYRSVIIEVTGEKTTLKSKILQQTLVLGDDEVLINGLVWSTKSVGDPGKFAENVDDPGMLYQFNRKVGYPTTPATAPANWPATYVDDKTDWLPENDPSPEGYRVPTTAEMAALWTLGSTWVTAAQTGFAVDGIIVGISEESAKTATKENLKQLGGLFIPMCGWRNEVGVMANTWLAAVRSSTSLHNISGNDADSGKGGMSLGDSGGYRDLYGWGDGAKARAGIIKPVKKIEVEE